MRPLHCERVFAAEKADSNNNMEQVPPKAGKGVHHGNPRMRGEKENRSMATMHWSTLSGAGEALSEISASPASMNSVICLHCMHMIMFSVMLILQ